MSDSYNPAQVVAGVVSGSDAPGLAYSMPVKVSDQGVQYVGLSSAINTPVYLWSFQWSPSEATAGGGDEYMLATAAIGYTADHTPGVPLLRPTRTNAGTPTTDADVTVGVVAANIVAANLNRRSLTLQNNGTADIFLDFTSAAALNEKFLLAAGATASWSGENCPATAVSAISSVAAQRLYVLET